MRRKAMCNLNFITPPKKKRKYEKKRVKIKNLLILLTRSLWSSKKRKVSIIISSKSSFLCNNDHVYRVITGVESLRPMRQPLTKSCILKAVQSLSNKTLKIFLKFLWYQAGIVSFSSQVFSINIICKQIILNRDRILSIC